jgi:hypothetical protein
MVARTMFNRANGNRTGSWLGRSLHEKIFAINSVWIALHDHGAVLQVRKKPRRDVRVVLQQVSLGQA